MAADITQIAAIAREKTTLTGTESLPGQDDGGGPGSSFRTTLNTLAKYTSTYISSYHSVKNLRDFAGFDNTGVSDSTANWEAAMAGGGTVEIPPGTYLLNGCDIPTVADITLKPLGPVNIKWAATGNDCLLFNCASLVSANVTVSLVDTVTDWPVNFNQALTRIYGSFSGWSVGDYAHIMSNDTAYDTYVKGEMFKVIYVHNDNSYIICDRVLFYAYDAAVNTTTCRRVTATPKLTILPGMVFDTAVSPIGALAARPYGLRLIGAVEPEVSAEFRNCYATSLRVQGGYGGSIDIRIIGVDVDYDDGAYGYGLELRGPVYGLNCSVYGDKGGHIFVSNGEQQVYSTSSWHLAGVPQSFVVKDFYSRSAVASPLDMHWAIRPRVVSAVIEDSHRDANVARSAQHGLYVGAIDPWFGNVSIKNTLTALAIRDHRGLPTRYRIDNLFYESTVQSPTTPALIANDGYSQVGGSRPVVEIGGGTVKVTGRFPILASGSHDDGYNLKLWNVSFYGSPGLIWYNSATYPAYVEFHKGCVWYPDTNSTDGILRADQNCVGRVRVFDLTIVRDGGSTPNGFVRASASVTASILVGEITLDSSSPAVALKTSGAHATSVVTFSRLPTWPPPAAAAPTTGTWSVGDIVYNSAPAAGGFLGWVCVTAGTPGTWKQFGVIEL